MKKVIISVISILATIQISMADEKYQPSRPETALQAYLEKPDACFSWELVNTKAEEGLTAYNILLVSQEWKSIVWRHQLLVLIPEDIRYHEAMLFIGGGHNENGQPGSKPFSDATIQALGQVARKNKAPVAYILQVPNQPLFGGLIEDEIVALTFKNYKETGDFEWPLLFPMVKSAVRAMDTVQAFAKESLKYEISGFMVTGMSKRGWTTWLTGAADSRVVAIAPMVIDMLNMTKSIDYHVEAWGDYSAKIGDYVSLGIAQDMETDYGRDLVRMVDPFSYREKLTMPKLIFNGTSDAYWPVDAIKHYLDEIPGENFLHYVANAGHGLGNKQQALQALSAFFAETLRGRLYPECSWRIEEKSGRELLLTMNVSPERLVDVVFWSSNSEDRDFRDNNFVPQSILFHSTNSIAIPVAFPDSGYRAFYVDLVYTDPDGQPYTRSSRVFVVDPERLL